MKELLYLRCSAVPCNALRDHPPAKDLVDELRAAGPDLEKVDKYPKARIYGKIEQALFIIKGLVYIKVGASSTAALPDDPGSGHRRRN